jgi:hypothetical protein
MYIYRITVKRSIAIREVSVGNWDLIVLYIERQLIICVSQRKQLKALLTCRASYADILLSNAMLRRAVLCNLPKKLT